MPIEVFFGKDIGFKIDTTSQLRLKFKHDKEHHLVNVQFSKNMDYQVTYNLIQMHGTVPLLQECSNISSQSLLHRG